MFRIVTVSFVDGFTKAVLMNVSPDRDNVISVPIGSEIRLYANGYLINIKVTGVCKIARAEARFIDCEGQLPSSDMVGTLVKSGSVFVFQARKSVDQDGQLGQRPLSNTA
jgi:hypothetical protein